MTIRSLLVNELKDTKSVMYDLRGNSGGDVKFANSMVQLFNLQTPLARLISAPWESSMMEGATLHVKNFPVEFRTRCWNHLWRDKQTGGGGAIVMKLDPTLVRAPPSDFQSFHSSNELTRVL
ncbi:hypothetical protein BASA61_003500 [Batrachochytrium salamandrivorans]|nr:hypothetical protein BASA61_003500 [Batrachochytrium salamandrivorans]